MARLSAVLAASVSFLVIGGGVAAGGPGLDARPPSLCSATEEVVFGCAQGGKLISLCAASATGARGRTRLRYLYGTRARIELDVSQAKHPDAFSSGVAALSGGGIDFVRVRNGDFAYVVYTGLTPGWSQDGWIVEAHGAPISHHICKRVATGADAWAPVYAAKLPSAPDSESFSPPDWVGSAPQGPARRSGQIHRRRSARAPSAGFNPPG